MLFRALDMVMRKTYTIFLQYLLEHQNPSDNYFNRFFLLKDRLINEHSCREKKIDRAKSELEKAGFITISNNHVLCITNEGIRFLHHENQNAMLGWLEKFTQYFNKKLVAVVGTATLALAIYDLFFNTQNSIVNNIVQSITVKIINLF
jgi:hypothetical protein